MGAANRSTDDTLSVDGHEFNPLPETWAEYGHHVDLEESGGQSRVYAVSVAVDEAQERLLVRYVHPVNPGAFVRGFDAVRHDGSWLPKSYANDGPAAFPVSLGVSYFQDGVSEVRIGERDRLWELYEDRLADTQYSRGGQA